MALLGDMAQMYSIDVLYGFICVSVHTWLRDCVFLENVQFNVEGDNFNYLIRRWKASLLLQ